MRLPWGTLDRMQQIFIRDSDIILLGCLSFEERAAAVPELLLNSRVTTLIEVIDPPDAFPDHSAEIQEKIKKQRARLMNSGVDFQKQTAELVVSEDRLLEILKQFLSETT